MTPQQGVFARCPRPDGAGRCWPLPGPGPTSLPSAEGMEPLGWSGSRREPASPAAGWPQGAGAISLHMLPTGSFPACQGRGRPGAPQASCCLRTAPPHTLSPLSPLSLGVLSACSTLRVQEPAVLAAPVAPEPPSRAHLGLSGRGGGRQAATAGTRPSWWLPGWAGAAGEARLLGG